MCLFADDSNVFVTSSNLTDLFTLANDMLAEIFIWTTSNKLSINFEKTNYMIFKPSKIINDFINNYKLKIVINDKIINRVNIVKYLGLYIDENLTWSEHIKQLTSKLSSLIGIIFRKRYIIPNNCKRNIYFALAYSHLIYCIEIYGKAKVSVLNPLVTKCNALLRILQNKPRLSSTKDLYTSYNTLPIHFLYKLAILNFMHRIIYNPHNDVPSDVGLAQ